MRRREFIALLGGVATAWPLAVNGQQTERTRHIGVLMVIAQTDPQAGRFVKSFETRLGAAGWYKGRNLEITYRWGASNPELLARFANELVRAEPDVLVPLGTPALVALHKATPTIPIVFTSVSDPVAQGFLTSLAHPGGNMTGFSNYEANIGGKWLQLLKQVAPSVTHATIMFNPRTAPYNSLWMHAIETAAPGFGISVAQASVETDQDIRDTIGLLGTNTGSSLIVPADSYTYEHSALITSLANDSRIPGVYAFSRFVDDGGLIAYGVDLVEQFGRAADYVSRILKGEKPGDLPVQGPTRYTLAINLKTAKAFGLTIAPGLIASADEVIE